MGILDQQTILLIAGSILAGGLTGWLAAALSLVVVATRRGLVQEALA